MGASPDFCAPRAGSPRRGGPPFPLGQMKAQTFTEPPQLGQGSVEPDTVAGGSQQGVVAVLRPAHVEHEIEVLGEVEDGVGPPDAVVGGPVSNAPDRVFEPVFDAKPEPVADQTLVMAREGYAVGSLTVNAMCINFMKKTDKGLDPKDKYVSPWYGRKKGESQKVLTGNGRFAGQDSKTAISYSPAGRRRRPIRT